MRNNPTVTIQDPKTGLPMEIVTYRNLYKTFPQFPVIDYVENLGIDPPSSIASLMIDQEWELLGLIFSHAKLSDVLSLFRNYQDIKPFIDFNQVKLDVDEVPMLGGGKAAVEFVMDVFLAQGLKIPEHNLGEWYEYIHDPNLVDEATFVKIAPIPSLVGLVISQEYDTTLELDHQLYREIKSGSYDQETVDSFLS